MYCPNCGEKVTETDRFCGKCGAPVNAVQTTQNSSLNDQSTNYYSTSYDAAYDNGYNGDVKAVGGLKGWLWFIIIANILGAVYTVGTMVAYSSYLGTDYMILLLASLLVTGGIIFAAARLLSGYKHGFYIICVCMGVALILNLIAGLYSSVIGNIVGAVILWLFLRKQWTYFK